MPLHYALIAWPLPIAGSIGIYVAAAIQLNTASDATCFYKLSSPLIKTREAENQVLKGRRKTDRMSQNRPGRIKPFDRPEYNYDGGQLWNSTSFLSRVEDGIGFDHDELSQKPECGGTTPWRNSCLRRSKRWRAIRKVRVIVLEGGEKAFSAGGDIGYFYSQVKAAR